MPENIAINDTIVCGVVLAHDGVTAYSISDSLLNTWTGTTPTSTGTGGGQAYDIWFEYTKSSSAGADTISLTRTSGTGTDVYNQCAHFQNLGAVDGAVANASVAPPAGPTFIGTISTSITTTVNGDVLISLVQGENNGTHIDSPGASEMISQEGPSTPSLSLVRTTTLGAYTPSVTIWGGSARRAMQTIAFKPKAIMITDTIMPDGGVGIAYSAQLHGIGGTAAQTYSCTGLPSNGLSLNTTTGVISGSNPTAGTVSISCTTTDGTNTSSAAALTIKIGATLPSVFVRQTNNTWSGDNLPNSFTMNVQCGDTIVFFRRGADTHQSQGMVMADTGVNNYVKDSFGSTVRRFGGPIPGNIAWPLVADVIGPITQSGVDTISTSDNQGMSIGRSVSLALDIAGGFVVDDQGAALSTMTGVATGSFSASYTTVVPNTLLLAVSDTYALPSTMTMSAPFSTFSNPGDTQGMTVYGSATISSAGSTTATINYTGGTAGGGQQSWDELIIPVRPALVPASCPTAPNIGEKIKRNIY